MIDYLRRMAIFARVVDEGSFRAAARAIGLAPSRISQAVSELEDYLGVTLLYRSTRKMSLTNEGRIFYAEVVEMLRSAEKGLNALNGVSVEPIGALKISIPSFMSSSSVATAIADFSNLYRQVTITVHFNDHPVKLIEDGYDLSIRVGWLADSSMMSRKLGESGRDLVAGIEYVASRPQAKHPKDLEDWEWIRYPLRPNTAELISNSGEVFKIEGESRLQVDSIDALYYFACRNAGVTVLPSHLAKRGISEGKLVKLLSNWHLQPIGYYALWLDQSRRENLTLLLVRFLASASSATAHW